jgi:serine/threonine-protein kinase
MAGTPFYMAPEMLGGSGTILDERSDVYLLGAILYEIVVGHPPHVGANLMAVVSAVATSSPEIPDDAPEELRAILSRAMARSREERFETVDAFRLALIEFTEHRASMAITAEADERRAHLAGYIAASEANDDRARDRIYTLFSECRFGYRSALDSWRDNQEAKDGLRAATEAMIDYELAQKEPHAAAVLAAQLDGISEEIERRIHEATEQKEAERDAARRAREQEDQSIGRRTRVFLTFILSSLWTVIPIGIWLSGYEAGWAGTFTVPILLVLLLLGLGAWARESLSRTAFNRRVSGLVFIAFAMEIPLHLGQWLMGMDPAESQVQAILLWATALAFGMATIDRRVWVATVTTTLGYFVACTNVELRWPVMAVNAVIMLVNVSYVWHWVPDDVQLFHDRMHQRFSRFTRRPPPPPSP